MPVGPDLRLWSRPNDHKDQAVVGMVTVKAPLCTARPRQARGKHSPAGPIIVSTNSDELGSYDCPDVVEVI